MRRKDEERHRRGKPFYTIKDIAERWDVTDRTVQRTIERGDLVAHRFGGSVRVSGEDLFTYEAARRGR